MGILEHFRPLQLKQQASLYPIRIWTIILQKSHYNTVNFRPLKIGKNWIASGFRPRNDEKYFRPKRTKKYSLESLALNVSTDFLFRNCVSSKENSSALCSLLARTLKWVLILIVQIKKTLANTKVFFMGGLMVRFPNSNSVHKYLVGIYQIFHLFLYVAVAEAYNTQGFQGY